MGKHLDFYKRCIKSGKMPYWGLCACSLSQLIDSTTLSFFKPVTEKTPNKYYWASGDRYERINEFTPLRQTIVLFMAAMNNEL